MEVVNIHRRKIDQSKEKVSLLFKTLATKEDKIWPIETWPAMRFHDGLKVGSEGGHGRIRYTIISYKEKEHISFEFTKPNGFIGTHTLCIHEFSREETEIRHEIKMHTSSMKASFFWLTTVRWLHDALIEDAFDKWENHFLKEKKVTKHSIWVRFLKYLYSKGCFN